MLVDNCNRDAIWTLITSTLRLLDDAVVNVEHVRLGWLVLYILLGFAGDVQVGLSCCVDKDEIVPTAIFYDAFHSYESHINRQREGCLTKTGLQLLLLLLLLTHFLPLNVESGLPT